jgi:hypothetical protein
MLLLRRTLVLKNRESSIVNREGNLSRIYRLTMMNKVQNVEVSDTTGLSKEQKS